MASEVVEASGHLIDSGILHGIFDTVIRHNATFEVVRFTIGRTNAEPSLLTLRVTGSVDTGKHVARTAADTLKRVHLELGGKAPVVVFDEHLQAKDVLVDVSEAVQLMPDDWPAFADPAWASRSDVTDDEALRSLAVRRDDAEA